MTQIVRDQDLHRCEAAVSAYATVVGIDPTIEWQMQPSEQAALIAILSGMRPKVAVEIGSRYGGSMQILARYAERVLSLDIDDTCQERLGPKHLNAEFITGFSQETFGPLLDKLTKQDAELGFVLIDGDHSAKGVRGDIECLLNYRPRCPMFVVMHDSFNPDVRSGIRKANWHQNPFVHSVELDYVPGVLVRCEGDGNREMWGGFALAILLPNRRDNELVVTARMQHLYDSVFRHSVHWMFDPPTLARRCLRKARRLVGLGNP
jgi:cephalosporin hydroxylase